MGSTPILGTKILFIMTLQEFNSIKDQIMNEVDNLIKRLPEIRKGQALFNIAVCRFPEQVERIRGAIRPGGFDPYYNNGNIDNFWNYLQGELVE